MVSTPSGSKNLQHFVQVSWVEWDAILPHAAGTGRWVRGPFISFVCGWRQWDLVGLRLFDGRPEEICGSSPSRAWGGIKPSSSWQNAFFLHMIGYAGTNQPYLDSDFFGLYSGYFGFVMVCPIEIVWFIWIYRQFCNFWALWEMGVITHPSATSRAHYRSPQGPAAWSRTRSHSLRLRRRPVVWGSLPGWHRWKVCQRTRPPGSYRYLRLCHSSNVENPWPSSNWMEMYGKLSNHGKSSNWIFLGVPVAMLDYPRVDMENTTKIQKTSLSFDCWELNNLYLY